MRFHLLHAGTLIGVAELRAEAAARAGDAAADVTLVGTLAPTDAYAQVRPLLQQLVQTAAAADPRAAQAAGPRAAPASLTDVLQVLWQVATLPLSLTRPDGTPVVTRQILVLDGGAMESVASSERGPVITAIVPAEEASRFDTVATRRHE